MTYGLVVWVAVDDKDANVSSSRIVVAVVALFLFQQYGTFFIMMMMLMVSSVCDRGSFAVPKRRVVLSSYSTFFIPPTLEVKLSSDLLLLFKKITQ